MKRILLGALAASAACVAVPASAQVAGIAYANPTTVVAGSKAFTAARQQISTTFKASFDQIQARRDALQKEVEPLLMQLDTNKDKQISDDEIKAAQAAKNPVLDRLKTLQTTAEGDIAKLTNPAARAELFAIESILRQYEAAQLRVVNARKISVVLSPEVFMYAPDSADISSAIVAELDKTLPTVGIQAPADWQPSRETLAIQQQLVQLAQMRAYQAQAQQQAGAAPAAGTAPAAGAKPAKPAEPR
ncbi:OmpH family outer membrane protein [Sphingomonas sp. CJ20]